MTSSSTSQTVRPAHDPAPWHQGTRKGSSASGIYAYDATGHGEDDQHFDTRIADVYGISLHTTVEEGLKNERNARGMANAAHIVRCVNENARLHADKAALVKSAERIIGMIESEYLILATDGSGRVGHAVSELRAALQQAAS